MEAAMAKESSGGGKGVAECERKCTDDLMKVGFGGSKVRGGKDARLEKVGSGESGGRE